MVEKKTKILQIAGGFRENINGIPISGGIAAMLNNYCSMVDKDRFTFDFMALRNQCFEQYRGNLEKNGWNLYCLNIQENGVKKAIKLISLLGAFVRKKKYDVVHINIGSFFPVFFCAIASKIGGAKIIIVHSHSSGTYTKRKRLLSNFFKPLLVIIATKYCACSKVAAMNLFPKWIIKKGKCEIIKNAIDTEKFKFNAALRIKVRKELGLKDELVVGHVGRFVDAKNHFFLLSMFREIKKDEPTAKLLLLGDGQLREEIENKARDLDIYQSIMFMGQRSDAYKFYQAMDVFVLPSLYEGFPIVVLEAQCAGIPCYVSDTVSKEVNISELYHSFSLKDDSKILASRILENLALGVQRKDMSSAIKNSGYELQDNISRFEELYS